MAIAFQTRAGQQLAKLTTSERKRYMDTCVETDAINVADSKDRENNLIL